MSWYKIPAPFFVCFPAKVFVFYPVETIFFKNKMKKIWFNEAPDEICG